MQSQNPSRRLLFLQARLSDFEPLVHALRVRRIKCMCSDTGLLRDGPDGVSVDGRYRIGLIDHMCSYGRQALEMRLWDAVFHQLVSEEAA